MLKHSRNISVMENNITEPKFENDLFKRRSESSFVEASQMIRVRGHCRIRFAPIMTQAWVYYTILWDEKKLYFNDDGTPCTAYQALINLAELYSFELKLCTSFEIGSDLIDLTLDLDESIRMYPNQRDRMETNRFKEQIDAEINEEFVSKYAENPQRALVEFMRDKIFSKFPDEKLHDLWWSRILYDARRNLYIEKNHSRWELNFHYL